MNNRPIILDNVSARSTDCATPSFFYDREQDMSVVKRGHEGLPFIESATSASELMTKTEVFRERDDDITELYSKTFVERERDDEDGSTYH